MSCVYEYKAKENFSALWTQSWGHVTELISQCLADQRNISHLQARPRKRILWNYLALRTPAETIMEAYASIDQKVQDEGGLVTSINWI